MRGHLQTFLVAFAGASLAVPLALVAAGVGPLTSFSNGTVANATAVNQNFAALSGGLDHFTFAPGKVGIGDTTPATELDVGNGALRVGGRTIKRITSCTYTGVPSTVGSASECRRAWAGSDCDNGLPSGNCLGFLRRAQHGGADQDWMVYTPAELAPNGGMNWWNGNGCVASNALIASAVYFCDQ